ncbi:MAG TPA: hypothetical protein VMM16_12085 [Verrucomicrobiae bacterium]|nr:hypothetical protein [Verrucomicrobiae bacterium]
MLKLRIERAPLKAAENRVILEEYNRLTGGSIPMNEFVHWVAENPAGAAWHALLETEEGRLVGHTSVFPLLTSFAAGAILPAKSEYSFMHEDFRREKVRHHEGAGKSAFIVALDQLFKHCVQQGWSPIFASTNEKNQVFTRKVGLRPLEFPLWECLLILRPAAAARSTPNLTKQQRLGMFSAGVGQAAAWSLVALLLSPQNGVSEVPVGKNGFPPENGRVAFFQDTESLEWRYLDGQYVRFEAEDAPGEYVVARRGTPSKFLRVCQWKLDSAKALPRILRALVRQARQDRALGVRWAVYGKEPSAELLVRRMRRAGFLCARRTRIIMVHNKEEKFLEPSIWLMNDSLFSFDP